MHIKIGVLALLITSACFAQHQQGFAAGPIIARDDECARDYSKAFLLGGLELRKQLMELERYGCIDSTASGLYRVLSLERRNVSSSKSSVAFFRHAVLTFDHDLNERILPGSTTYPPKQIMYVGWIPDQDFIRTESELKKIAEHKATLQKLNRVTGGSTKTR